MSAPAGSIGVRHGIRNIVGATHGHDKQGTPEPAAIDTGTVHVTSRRVLFDGGRRARVVDFEHLTGIRHEYPTGRTTFSLENRLEPVTIAYGPGLASWFDFRLELAMAHYGGTVLDLVASLQADLAIVDRARPIDPATARGWGGPERPE
jgi:hypothetical protein